MSLGKVKQTGHGTWDMQIQINGKRYRRRFQTESTAYSCLNALRKVRDEATIKEILLEAKPPRPKRTYKPVIE